jgi:iron complex outermembrane receptor protein
LPSVANSNEKAEYDINTALASQASSSGYAEAKDQSGSRNISAIFTELSIPVVKNLELSLAARYDHYNDVGGSFNPKVGVRWQPTNQVCSAARTTRASAHRPCMTCMAR